MFREHCERMRLSEAKQGVRIQGMNHCPAYRAQINRSEPRREVMTLGAESIQALTSHGAYHGAFGPGIGGVRQEVMGTDWNSMMGAIGNARSCSAEGNNNERTVSRVAHRHHDHRAAFCHFSRDMN